MSWKDVLKAHCGTEKLDTEEKKLVGNQKRIDADKDGTLPEKILLFCERSPATNLKSLWVAASNF